MFHALRHTYASLCVAAGIPPLQLSRFMGHAKVTTTLGVYTHLFDDDHAETMAALEAMSRAVDAPRGADASSRLTSSSVLRTSLGAEQVYVAATVSQHPEA